MALKTGFALNKVMGFVDGTVLGFLTSFKAPDATLDEIKQAQGGSEEQEYGAGNLTIGEMSVTQNFAHKGPIYELIRSVFDKSCKEFQFRAVYANQDYKGMREVIATNCYLKSVKFSDLKASDGKKYFDVTWTAECEDVEYKVSSEVVQAPVGDIKHFQCANFQVIGLPFGGDDKVTEVTLPSYAVKQAKEYFGHMKLPELHVANWETTGLKTTFAATVFPDLLKYYNKIYKDRELNPSDHCAFGVDLKDPSMKKTLQSFEFNRAFAKKVTFFGEAKSGEQMSNPVCEWAVQRFTMK